MNTNFYNALACKVRRIIYVCIIDSIKWMEDSDKENIEKETLDHQYEMVKKETNTSTVGF